MQLGLSFKEPMMGEAIACLFEARRGWCPAFIERSATDALRALDGKPVSLLLVDTTGIEDREVEALLELRESGKCPVALLVGESDAQAYLDLPFDRVLSRLSPTDEILAGLDEILRPANRLRNSPKPFDLSRRELECAQLVARGLSNRRIAEMTGLREQSVKNVVSLAMRKLSADNRVQVALRLNQIGAADDGVPTRAVVSISVADARQLVGDVASEG